MTAIRILMIGIVAFLHVYFLVLEMFLWTQPKGLATFKMTLEKANETAILAANQGLYNGFLAAGLIWALVHPDAIISKQLALFFLGCVIIAAVYGGYSVNIRIFLIQGLPAIVSLLILLAISKFVFKPLYSSLTLVSAISFPANSFSLVLCSANRFVSFCFKSSNHV